MQPYLIWKLGVSSCSFALPSACIPNATDSVALRKYKVIKFGYFDFFSQSAKRVKMGVIVRMHIQMKNRIQEILFFNDEPMAWILF